MALNKQESYNSFLQPMSLLNQTVHTKRSKSNTSTKEKKERVTGTILEPTISEIQSPVFGRNINLSIDRLGSNIL
jgi:hypothetical protein